MELEIDFAIADKYSDYHECYSRNLKIFRRLVRTIELFFKKEKYENSQVIADDKAENQVTIRFCARNYRLRLNLDPAGPDRASIQLEAIGDERPRLLAQVTIVKAVSVIFPGRQAVSLNNEYEFNDAVLDFFITAISRPAAKTAAGSKAPARK